MSNPELEEGTKFTIQPGQTVNFGLHEDSDFRTFDEPMNAKVTGKPTSGAVPISIEGFDPECSLFFHLPEKDSSENGSLGTSGEKSPEPIDPVGNLVRTFALEQEDPMSPEGQHAISEAILHLGFCDDTMALLQLSLQRAKNPGSGSYKDIRSQFPAGQGPAED